MTLRLVTAPMSHKEQHTLKLALAAWRNRMHELGWVTVTSYGANGYLWAMVRHDDVVYEADPVYITSSKQYP